MEESKSQQINREYKELKGDFRNESNQNLKTSVAGLHSKGGQGKESVH